MSETIYIGQNITKDCVVGDRFMNRYAIFNGLELPRRIDYGMNVTSLGVEAAATPTSATAGNGGSLTTDKWYAYKAVYASTQYLRPVAVNDGSANFTRGNPSAALAVQLVSPQSKATVVVPTISQEGIDMVLLYRSLASGTQDEAEAGPFFYVGQAAISGATVTFVDTVADTDVGEAVEMDNYPPNAYRYAVSTHGYVFAGGNFLIGSGLACTASLGSSMITVGPGSPFYDGIRGWRFRLLNDTVGGVNGSGLYYANYVDGSTLQLVDPEGTPVNYDGDSAGSNQPFVAYLPGFVLRWCKYGEPEAWPLENLINFDGDITGIAAIPNQTLLLVCTDAPSMYVLDLNMIGTDTFKTQRFRVSSEYTVSSHFSLCAVDGRMRGIDAHKGCIIETDGTAVINVSGKSIPKVFKFLDNDLNRIKLWHCAYDQKQRIFGAFVTFRDSLRIVDFCLGQHTLTGGWFFNFEKDLLCTGLYTNPESGETLVLGGTEGPGGDTGGIWGRIWCPDVYSEWIPTGCRVQGTITSATSTSITVDPADGVFSTLGDGLKGRWVLVCDSEGEHAQVGYITDNTADTLVIEGVVNGFDATQFSPAPTTGWKFYVGLIEMRWGPKRFDFDDPDTLKKIWEVWCCVSDHDEANPPFMRLYRGFTEGYLKQLPLIERHYLDRTKNQSLVNSVDSKLEPVPRWGVAWYDRSYDKTTLHSLSIVFSVLGKGSEK